MSKIPLDSASKMVKITAFILLIGGGGQLLRMGEYTKPSFFIVSTFIAGGVMLTPTYVYYEAVQIRVQGSRLSNRFAVQEVEGVISR
jgi:hypothetical protein